MATEFIQSIRSSGGQYTSLSSWEAALPSNLTLSSIKVFSHGGITGTLSDGDTVTGATSGATGTIEQEVTTGQILISAITGTFTSGEQVYQTSGVNYVTISDSGDSPICVAEGYNDNWGYGTGILQESDFDFQGVTTNASNYCVIRAATGEEHSGSFANGFEVQITGWLKHFNINNNYTQIYDVKISYATSSLNVGILVKLHGAATSGKNLIIIDKGTGANGGVDIGNYRYHTPTTLINTIVEGFTNKGFHSGNLSDGNFYNCVAVNCGTGFDGYDATYKATLKNCIAYNCTTDFGANMDNTNSATCATSDASATESWVTVTSITVTDFTDAANDDYHIPSTSGLYDAGTDLSGTFTTDIDGDTRTVWSIGIDEFTSSGATIINIASATNAAFGINVVKTKSLGFATTVNTGQALVAQRSYSVSLSSENNSSFAFGLQKSFSISFASETNSGFTIATDTGVAISQAIETNSSFLVGIDKLITLGLSAETNSGFSIATQKTMATGFGQEVSSGFSLVADKIKSISLASEINSGFTIVADGATPVGQATEINASFAMGRLKNSAIGLSSETNSCFSAGVVKSVAISIATEVNTGFGVSWSKIMTIGQAIETNSGISIVIPGAMGWREVYQTNVYINRGAQSNCYITRSKQDDVSLGFTAHQEAGL